MSYDPRGPGAPGSNDEAKRSRKGSVRAARERLRAVQSQQVAEPLSLQSSLRQLPQSQYVQPNAPDRVQPTQAPQWSISAYDSDQNEQPLYAQQQWPLPEAPAPESRRLPPQRPVRGPDVPPMPVNLYDNSQNAMPSSSIPKFGNVKTPPAPQWQDDEYLSPTYGSSPALGRPLINSSMASDTSSIGSIPDFPVPSAQLPSNRRPQQIGPPPSARRGPSSYYSQFSYVSPIYEEAERASVRSFASSNVMPSAVPDFYLEDGEGETPSDEEDEATGGLNRRPSADHNDQSSLVRQASLGKRTKPTLTTIKSAESISSPAKRPYMPSLQSPPHIVTPKVSRSRLRDSSVLFDDSSPSSEELSMKFGDTRNNESPSYQSASPAMSRSPINPRDSRVDQIFGGLERGGALDLAMAKAVRQSTRGSLADRVGSKRPPRLNVDAVREAEARGSMTSLPDLIRRATRLAANLDRGKTASRLGWDWINTGEEEKHRKSGGGLSGILSAFPPPGARTPTTPRTNWPSNTGSDRSLNPRRKYETQNSPAKTGRRCCGMPLWGFIVVVSIIFLLVAAAVVLPVVLIVLPNQRASTTADPGAVANAQCATKNPCSNGGSSVLQQDGTCACLCTNGFTGPQCKTAGDGGCKIISLGGTKSASIGNQLPALFDAAAKNYSIPLSETRLLALFSTTGMTCGSENALVTFSGSSSTKRSMIDTKFDGLRHAAREERRAPAATTNGVAVTSSRAKATPTVSGAASTTVPVVITTGSSAPGTNATSKEFAKVGILFVLQESQQIDIAVQAQTAVSDYMTSAIGQGSTMGLAHNVTLGNGYSIDLWYWTVTLANGTVYGNGYNGTATSLSLTTPAAV